METQISKKFNNLIHFVAKNGDLGQAVYMAFENQIDSAKCPAKEFEKRFDEWAILIKEKRVGAKSC